MARRFMSTVLKESTRNSSTDPYGYFLLVIPATTFGLGTWQVYRRRWKLDLIKGLEERIKSDPIVLPTEPFNAEDLEYRRVKVRGTFDHSKEIFLLPRSFQKPSYEKLKFFIPQRDGQSGTHVITPFYIPDRGYSVLVNRGWVPKHLTEARLRPLGQVEGEVELEGVVRKTNSRSSFQPENDLKRNRWFYGDHEAMAEHTGAIPVLIDATTESTFQGGPIGGQTRVSMRNEHWQYIITWYSLSLATAIMWYYAVIKTKKFPRSNRPHADGPPSLI